MLKDRLIAANEKRPLVELKSGASKVVTLLSAMLKALVSRRVKITPEELQVTDA